MPWFYEVFGECRSAGVEVRQVNVYGVTREKAKMEFNRQVGLGCFRYRLDKKIYDNNEV